MSDIGFEYGVSPGDEFTSGTDDYQGGVIRGNTAYEVDNLLFKHVIPTLYGSEAVSYTHLTLPTIYSE